MRTLKLWSTAILAIVVGCADDKPARIDVAATSLLLVDSAQTPLGARLVNGKGESLSMPPLSYSATPIDILTTGEDGTISCRATGDGTVIVAGGGQSASVTVSCRLIAAIHGPSDVRLILGRAPERAAFTAVDDKGMVVADANLTITILNPSVVRYGNQHLVPVAIGQSTVVAEAGAAQRAIQVSVVQMIESEPLALRDGATMTWTLHQGSYELDLNVKATGSTRAGDGVTISWVGGNCPDVAEATYHNVKCTVANSASLTVRNPTAFGLGPSLNGFINIYRTAP